MLNLLLSASGHTVDLLSSVFVIFASAKVLAEVFERLGQPAVVGEILAGVLIGPHALRWVELTDTTTALAEIGVILLLFNVGLEVRPSEIFKVGKRAMIVAVGGVVLPFFFGWGLMALWGDTSIRGVFMGAAMVATSVGITARVLAGMGLLGLPTSQIILGAAVIDDILGLLVLSIVASTASGTINYAEIGLTAGLSIGFTLFTVLVAGRIINKVRGIVDGMRLGDAYFFFAVMLCLGFSWLATEFNVAPIIGAFLAGMALADLSSEKDFHTQVSAVTEFLVPFFFVSIGLQLDLSVFREPSVIALAVVATVVAVATKLIGCGAGAWPLGRRQAMQVGMGMVPRGEVGIIVAQVGLSLGVLTGSLYGVVVFMAVATTLVAPPMLTRLFAGEANPNADN